MKSKDITLNPRKSTCIVQVEAGETKATENRVAVVLEKLTQVLQRKRPNEGVKYKVEERIVKGYHHDPVWHEMNERHKAEKREVELYLDSLDNPIMDSVGTMRFPTQVYRTHRISVQL